MTLPEADLARYRARVNCWCSLTNDDQCVVHEAVDYLDGTLTPPRRVADVDTGERL